MAAYVIVQIEVSDWEKFREYLQEAPRVVRQYGGKYLARGGEMLILEGEIQPKRVVIIEFASLKQAQAWYNSEEYQRVKEMRYGTATGTIIALDGC